MWYPDNSPKRRSPTESRNYDRFQEQTCRSEPMCFWLWVSDRPKWRHPDLTSQYLRLLDSHILFDARLPSFFLKLMMIGDAVWRVVVRSFHNFSSACRCQMLTSFRPLVRCSKIAFQHFPTAVWAETCSQRCCHHPWSNTFRITTALVIFWGGELDTFFTWDSHVVVSGSWNISRSFSLAGCGCWHRHLW